ncbi:unnamed protein product [Polarella glacialis]|uniref:rRNA adenine N(6)-methyltransferase n=1 Tax=Polarella glacialis TaxID=89957 RepID=A0A813IEE0_POLGL|nr:unnamed protein product [Polarella glacialis]
MPMPFSVVPAIRQRWVPCLSQIRSAASTRGDFATTSLSGRDRLDPGKKKRAFREDCARVWGNLWDYNKTKFKENHLPISVTCQRHGAFWLKPRDHIQRREGCPKCGILSLPGTLQESAAAVFASGSAPRPSLGQHLLRSREIANQIAEVAIPDDEEGMTVAEVGVGGGALTEALLERPGCKRVIGFEVDDEMVKKALRKGSLLDRRGAIERRLPESARSCNRQEWSRELEGISSRCIVFKGDFLTTSAVPGDCEVATGNVPYRISSALVTRLLCQQPPLKRIVLLVQNEFARKLLAKTGSLKYGRVSALAGAICSSRDFALPGRISPEVFAPPPRVDSAVVCLRPRGELICRHSGELVSPRALDRLLRMLLGEKVKGPSRGLGIEAALSEQLEQSPAALPHSWRVAISRVPGLDPGRPAVSMEPEDFVTLTAELCRLGFEGVGDGRAPRAPGEDPPFRGQLMS